MFFYIYSQWISQKAIFEFGYRKFFHVMLATILIIITSVGCTIRPVQLASTKVSTAVENPKAVITFAVDKDWQNNYAPLVEEFQAIHPEIEVQLVNPPSDAWDYSALASTADVVLVNPGGNLNGYNYFLNLQSIAEADSSFNQDDFWPGSILSCQNAEGTMFGLPLIVYHMTVIFFDRSAFEKANLPVPTPGWTLADFKQTINALSNARDRHYVFMDNSHLQGSILAPFVDANLTSQNGEINAESLSGVVQWYVSASEQNKIYSMRNITDLALEKENLRSLFESEYPPAMWIGSLRDYSTMEPVEIDTNKFKADKLGVVPLPVDPDRSDSNTTPVWAQCAAISAASSHPREAWLLISFLSNQEPPFDNHFGMVSARQSVTTGSHLWKSLSPEVEAVVRFGLEHAWYGSQYPEVFTVLDSALMETLWMNKPLPDAIASTRNYSADSPAPTPDQTVFSIATPLPKHPSSEGVTSIRFYASLPTRENVQAFQAVVEEFHRLFPDISVNWRADLSDVHFETGQNKLSTLAANFDCFSSDFIPGKNLSDSGLLNLNVLLENEGPGFTKDFFPAIMDLYRMGGNQFGLPVTSRPWIMAYNADLLARRGLEPPAIDWDFHEFIRLITAATSTSEIDRSYGYLYWTWDNFLIQGGGVSWEDVNSYPPVLRLDSPKMQQVVSWINNLKQSGVLMYMGRGGNEEIQLSALKQAFLSGRIAFWITEAGYPKGWWTDEGDMPYKIGVAPMPAIDQKRQSLNGSTEYGLFISSSAPNPQACWTFMKFLSGQPKAFPGVPTRQSVASSAAWTNSVGYENANVYRQALSQAAHSEVTAIETDPVFWWLVDAITFVFDGSDPTQELTAAQYKVDTYVACMGNTEFLTLTDIEIQKQVKMCSQKANAR